MKFTFIDLCAGIGGFRLALEQLGGKCVFSSEIEANACKTYQENFGESPLCDLSETKTKERIPNHDILCAGFPCQSFSIAGKRGGFEDVRGTLFFDIADIIKRTSPKAILLENVKGLINHNKGKTLKTILNILRDELGYYVPDPKVLNSRNFGVPQNRERILIVGFRKDLNISDFQYPNGDIVVHTFAEVKEEDTVSVKYYLSDTYLNTLVRHKERHESKGNGFGYSIIKDNECANAIVVGGMGRERNLVLDYRLKDFTPITNIKGKVNTQGVRKMTPREWARLQGFPDTYKIPVSDSSAYKLFGNTVTVPLIKQVGSKILERLLLCCYTPLGSCKNQTLTQSEYSLR